MKFHLSDFMIASAFAAWLFAGLGVVTNNMRFTPLALMAGNTSFLLLTISSSERLQKNKQAIQKNKQELLELGHTVNELEQDLEALTLGVDL
jgi:hypothetical protein